MLKVLNLYLFQLQKSTNSTAVLRPKIKCLFAIAYLPTIFPPTQKILLGFQDFFFFFFFFWGGGGVGVGGGGDLVI